MHCRSSGGAVAVAVALVIVVGILGDSWQRAAAAEPRELAYISSAGSVQVIDTTTNELVSRIGSAEQVTALPGGERLLRAGFLDSIDVLDASSSKLVAIVPVVEQFDRRGIFGIDSDTAYVLSSNGVQVLDLATLSASLLPMPPPDFLALSPGVERAYAVNDSGAGFEVTVIDTSTDSVIRSATIPVGTISGVALSPNGSRLYLLDRLRALIIVLSANLSAVQVPIETDPAPRGIVVSSDGTSAYVRYRSNQVSVIDLATGTTVDRITLPHIVGEMALTGDGEKLFVLHPDDCSTSAVDLSTRTVTTTIDVGERPVAIHIVPAPAEGLGEAPMIPQGQSPRTNTPELCAYVTHSDAMTVIDVGTQMVRGTFPLSHPSRVAFSPDGTRAYVTHSINRQATGAVAVLDTATNAVLDEIIVGTQPHSIVIGDAGATGFIGQLRAPCSTLLSFDTTTKALRHRDQCPACSSPSRTDLLRARDVAISPDGRAYVVMSGAAAENAISIVDLTNSALIASIALPQDPGRGVLSPDGQKFYVTLRGSVGIVDSTTNTLADVIQVTRGDATAIGVSPDGQALLIGFSEGSGAERRNGVVVVDTNTKEVTASIALPSDEFIAGIAFTPDGGFAYAAGSELVSIVDTAARAAVATLPIPGQAEDIAIAMVPTGCAGPPAVCKGDCDGNREVTIDELLIGVHKALGTDFFLTCPALDTEEGIFQVDDLVAAVDNAVMGCRTLEP